MSELAEASERFSPADIEFAARKAAQWALEAAVVEGAIEDGDLRSPAAQTDSYLRAIAATRPTVSMTSLQDFEADIQTLART
jgi:SpoVK/Ycf46/Vps4 family AAA+-type ATPase